MAIPDFQSVMLPLLKFASDGREHSLQEAVDALAVSFQLTPEEKQELLPSGKQARFDNRVAWSKSYFKQACLVENTRRGYFRITQRGLELLKTNPSYVNKKSLERYPEFLAFQNLRREINSGEDSVIEPTQNSTPEEVLEDTHRKLNTQLANELLDIVKASTPAFFERLVVSLLVKMGYGGTLADAAASVTGRSGDEGIDGIINEDRLGLDAIYIQAKRWEAVIGRPEIQKFVGALQGQRAHKGVFITTSDFTKEASEYVKNISNKVVLINGFSLARLMIDNNVGVSVAATYAVKKIDSDYFVDE